MILLGIVGVGLLFYRVMAGFFVPLFLAVLLVVLFRPIHEWVLIKTKKRSRLACLVTTTLIMATVLLPVITVISIAAGQFTSMVSHVDFEDLTAAMQRARTQLGVALQHPEQFRRLDELADILGDLDDREVLRPESLADQNVSEALMLIRFLQDEEEGSVTADPEAANAELRLTELLSAIRKHQNPLIHSEVKAPTGTHEQRDNGVTQRQPERTDDNAPVPGVLTVNDSSIETNEGRAKTDLIQRIRQKEAFHRQSVIASASIRAWMREFLGGTFLSQVRLFANPSAEDFKEVLGRARQSLQPRFVTLTSVTGSFLVEVVIGLVVLVISVYFFLHDGPAMIRTLMRLSPLDDQYEERLLIEFERTSRAVVLASVASALVQGFLASVAFYYLGFKSVIFLFLISSLMALVPFLGAAAVWVPCAVYLAAVEQRWGAALFLAIYGATLVSSIDNVIKMYVLHGRSTLHPLFALLSVLGGVKVFGPIGILVGPMVVVFLQTLLEILNHELERRARSGTQDQVSPLEPSTTAQVNSVGSD